MAIDITNYTARMNAYGYETKDGKISHEKELIKSRFTLHPNYQSVTIDGTSRDVHIISSSSITTNPEINKMVAYPDETFENGQYVTWGDTTWITLNDFANDDVQNAIEIQRCRVVLNFSVEGNDYSYYASRKILSESSHGLSISQSFDLPSGDVKLYIKRDDITKTIYEGQRFLINGKGYSVELTEVLDFENVLTLYLSYDGVNKDEDDIENDIADNDNPSGWDY